MKGTRVVVYNSNVARNLPFPFLFPTPIRRHNHHSISRIWRNGMTPANSFWVAIDRRAGPDTYTGHPSCAMYIYYGIIYICIYHQMRHLYHPVHEGIISRKHVYCMLRTTWQSPLIFWASCPCDYYDYNNHVPKYDVYSSNPSARSLYDSKL